LFCRSKGLARVCPRLQGLWAVWQSVRVRCRRQMVFPSDRTFMAQRRADERPQITLWRDIYAVYRGDERLGADGAVGHRVLTAEVRASVGDRGADLRRAKSFRTRVTRRSSLRS